MLAGAAGRGARHDLSRSLENVLQHLCLARTADRPPLPAVTALSDCAVFIAIGGSAWRRPTNIVDAARREARAPLFLFCRVFYAGWKPQARGFDEEDGQARDRRHVHFEERSRRGAEAL